MTRKTPVRSKKQEQPSQKIDRRTKSYRRLRPASSKRNKEYKAYAKIRVAYLERNPTCERCKKAKSQDIHHKAGRYHRLLCDYRMFAALCRPCHDAVHANARQARIDGWIADGIHGAMDIDDALRYLEDPHPESQ